MLLGVQHLVLDAGLLELLGQDLRLGDRCGADQHRLALLVPGGDVLDDRGELRLLGAVDEVPLVFADHRHVRGDRHHAETVDLLELAGLGHRGAGHPGKLLVHPEEVLQGDRGEGLVLVADLHPLLGLDRLVQALVVAAADQSPAGVLVDDQDLAVDHHVVAVELEQLLGLDRVIQIGDQRGVGRFVQVVDAQPVLDHVDPVLQDRNGALLLVDLVMIITAEPVDQLGELRIPLVRILGRTGDDQRRPRLVDQDRVDLVHDGEVVLALHAVLQAQGHVVAQVVEAELVVGAVGDVGVIGLAPLSRVHLGQDGADLHAEEVMDAAHLLGLELGQVVVDRDHVYAPAGDRVQVGGHGGDQGLALTGLHLGDVAEVQGGAAHHLDVEVPLVEHPLAGLAYGRERLREQRFQRLALFVARLEVGRLAL